jgi:hypothetical protein
MALARTLTRRAGKHIEMGGFGETLGSVNNCGTAVFFPEDLVGAQEFHNRARGGFGSAEKIAAARGCLYSEPILYSTRDPTTWSDAGGNRLRLTSRCIIPANCRLAQRIRPIYIERLTRQAQRSTFCFPRLAT